jgi:hypothetical protein
MDKYILDDSGCPVVEPDVLTWGRWFEANTERRSIGRDQFGNARVSTVFLGLDHNFTHGDPVLWETMVFGGPLDGEQERYTSEADARRGHATMVARVKGAADPPLSPPEAT